MSPPHFSNVRKWVLPIRSHVSLDITSRILMQVLLINSSQKKKKKKKVQSQVPSANRSRCPANGLKILEATHRDVPTLNSHNKHIKMNMSVLKCLPCNVSLRMFLEQKKLGAPVWWTWMFLKWGTPQSPVLSPTLFCFWKNEWQYLVLLLPALNVGCTLKFPLAQCCATTLNTTTLNTYTNS